MRAGSGGPTSGDEIADMTDAFEQIEVRTAGSVGRIILDRPDRHNAQTARMWLELARAGEILTENPEIRVVVVSGNGPSFSSGIDLCELGEGGFIRDLADREQEEADLLVEGISRAQDSVRWMRSAPFLVIAAVHGAALGAGFQLALSCDVRVVAQECHMQLREVDHGLVPDLGATAVLPRLVGIERALDLILSGRIVMGGEAVAANLALRAVPADELAEVVDDYANSVARNSRIAIQAVKSSIHQPDYQRAMDVIRLGQAACIRRTLAAGSGART